MSPPNTSFSLADPTAMHLILETAIVDSREFHLLPFEVIDSLKRESALLMTKLEALKHKFALESKVRDAALSISRLGSQKNDLGQNRSLNHLGVLNEIVGINDGVVDDLISSTKQCEDLSEDINKVKSELWDRQKMLLQHTAGVLSRACRMDMAKSSINKSINKNPFPHQPSPIRCSEVFDDRSFYKLVGGLEDIHGTIAVHPKHSNSQRAYHDLNWSSSHSRTASQDPNKPLKGINLVRDDGPLHEPTSSLVGKRLMEMNNHVSSILSRLVPHSESDAVGIQTEAHGMQDQLSDIGLRSEAYRRSDSASMLDQLNILECHIKDFDSFAKSVLSKKSTCPDDFQRSIGLELQKYDIGLAEVRKSLDEDDGSGQSTSVDDSDSDYDNELPPDLYDEKDREHTDMIQKISSITTRSLKLYERNHYLRNSLASLALELRSIQDSGKNGEQQIAQLNESLSNAMKELTQMSAANDADASRARQELSKTQSDLLSAREKLAECVLANEQKLKDLESSTAIEINMLKDQLSNENLRAKKREGDFSDEVNEKSAEILLLKQTISSQTDELNGWEERFSRLSRETSELHDRLRSSQEACGRLEQAELRLTSRLEEHAIKQGTHGSIVQDMEKELERAFDSNGKITRQLQEQIDLANSLQGRVKELEGLMSEREQHMSKTSGMSAQINQLEARLSEAGVRADRDAQCIHDLRSNVSQLSQELNQLKADLEVSRASVAISSEGFTNTTGSSAIEDIRDSRSGTAVDLTRESQEIQMEKIILERRILELQEQLSQCMGSKSFGSNHHSDKLISRNEVLQKELDEMLVEYEMLTKASIDNEVERARLEAQIDGLQDKLETAERTLADERIRWLGMSMGSGVSGGGRGGDGQSPTVNIPLSSTGENMSTSILRVEFKKMVRDMRAEHMKVMRAEQELRRKAEGELRQMRKMTNA